MDKSSQKYSSQKRLYSAMLAIGVGQIAFGFPPAHVWAKVPEQSQTSTSPVALLTPQEIENKLMQHQHTQTEQSVLVDLADMAHGGIKNDTQSFIVQNNGVEDTLPIAKIDSPDVPIGLDMQSITKLPTLQSIEQNANQLSDQVGIEPSVYLPEYQQISDENAADDKNNEPNQKQNPFKKLYNHLFNDGVEKVPMLKVHLYEHKPNQQTKTTDLDKLQAITRSQAKQQPYANIAAALKNNTAQSIVDFRSALPKLRQTVLSAAQAVGYYEVDFSVIKAKSGEVNVIIHQLGNPVIIDHQVLDIRGEGKTDKAFEAVATGSKLKKSAIFNQGDYEQVKSDIASVSGEHGYFDSRWLNASADVLLPDNIADVNLVYETGQQYAFDDVVFFTIDPTTNAPTTDPDKLPVKPELLKKLLTFKMGDAYNRSAVRNLSNNLLATGYFNAVNTETVLPSASTQIDKGIQTEQIDKKDKEDASQTVDLGDGVSADIAPLEFTASQALMDKLALVVKKAERLYNSPNDRVLAINTNKKSKSLLGRISDAISNVAKFILPDETKDEAIAPEGQEPATLQGRKTAQEVYQDKKVPLYVFVATDKPKNAQIQFGWGSDSGAQIGTKFDHNLLNRDGMQAGFKTNLSNQNKVAQAYIVRPVTHPLNDTLKGSLSYKDENLDKGKGNLQLSSKTLDLGLSRNIVKKQGWTRTYSVRYHLDELETKLSPEFWKDLPVQFLGGKPTQEAVLFGYAMNKMVADNPLAVMQGYRQYYSVEAGTKALMSDTDMAIFRAGMNGVYSFGDNQYGKKRRHQVLGGLQAGYIWADNFQDVPYKLRFFAGGDQSIRGYSYNSLSPLSNKGYLTGGQVLAVATAEYNYEILKDVRLGVFSDVGNAYDTSFSNPTKIGVGVGVRWASPIGQVRVDVATGIREENRPIKLLFFIGTPF